MIVPIYFLGLAFLFGMINVHTYSKKVAKWITYHAIWLCVLVSILSALYYFYTGEELRL